MNPFNVLLQDPLSSSGGSLQNPNETVKFLSKGEPDTLIQLNALYKGVGNDALPTFSHITNTVWSFFALFKQNKIV